MEFTIRMAAVDDAALVHKTMMEAFEEYRHIDVPSSALNETISSIEQSLKTGLEKAILCFDSEDLVGSARFKTDEHSLYFSRLSVCPAVRRRGIARLMLSWLEDYAKANGKSTVWCRVRLSEQHNIQLYQSIGYFVAKEEIVTNPNGFPVKTVVMIKALK